MKPPSLLVSIMGWPPVSLLVLACCATLLYGWYSGYTAGVVAFFAAGLGFRTVWAFRQRRYYKQWRGAWNAMGAKDKPVVEKKQPKVKIVPVVWLMGRASSSPSRAEATRNLPEFSARLLKP